jgi:hypothetical protein
LALSGALALALAGFVTLSFVARAASPVTVRMCYQLFPMIDWNTKCFPAARVAAAERQMNPSPIAPRQTVWRLSGLRLRTVALLTGQFTEIDYMYGRVGLRNGVATFTTPGADYVLLAEHTGRLPGSQLGFVRQISRTQLASGRTVTSYGPWQLRTNLAGRNLYIIAQTNRGKGLERAILRALRS